MRHVDANIIVAAKRLYDRAKAEGDCLIPHVRPQHTGYTRVGIGTNGHKASSHRVIYAFHYGPIPNYLTIDHLCRNRACINIAHLELVTVQENIKRGNGIAVRNSQKEYCKYGHPFDNTNTYRRPDGARTCRICVNERNKRLQKAARARKKGQ